MKWILILVLSTFFASSGASATAECELRFYSVVSWRIHVKDKQKNKINKTFMLHHKSDDACKDGLSIIQREVLSGKCVVDWQKTHDYIQRLPQSEQKFSQCLKRAHDLIPQTPQDHPTTDPVKGTISPTNSSHQDPSEIDS